MSGNHFYLCATSQYKLQVLPDWNITLNFNGTPPFQFHTTVYRNGTSNCNLHILPQLTTNNYTWTVVSSYTAGGNESEVDGNRTLPVFRVGDSVVWTATEAAANGSTSSSSAHSSSFNYTIITEGMARDAGKSGAERNGISVLWKTALALGLVATTALAL